MVSRQSKRSDLINTLWSNRKINGLIVLRVYMSFYLYLPWMKKVFPWKVTSVFVFQFDVNALPLQISPIIPASHIHTYAICKWVSWCYFIKIIICAFMSCRYSDKNTSFIYYYNIVLGRCSAVRVSFPNGRV